MKHEIISTTHTFDTKYKSENRETKTRTDERKVNKGSCSQPGRGSNSGEKVRSRSLREVGRVKAEYVIKQTSFEFTSHGALVAGDNSGESAARRPRDQ